MAILGIPLLIFFIYLSFASIFIIFAFVVFMVFIRKRIKVHILREYGDSYKEIKTLKIPMRIEKFDFAKHTYIVNLSRSVFDKRNNPELFYKQEYAEPMLFQGLTNKRESSILRTVMKTRIFHNLLFSAQDRIWLIIVLALVVVIGGITVFSMWKITDLSNTIAKLQELQYIYAGGGY